MPMYAKKERNARLLRMLTTHIKIHMVSDGPGGGSEIAYMYTSQTDYSVLAYMPQITCLSTPH